MIGQLLSFILWLLIVLSIVWLRDREKYEVKEVKMNYSINDISDDGME